MDLFLHSLWICFLLSFQREAQEREEAEQVRLEQMRKEQEEEKEVRSATAGRFCAGGSLFPVLPLLQMCRSVRLVMFILHYTQERSQLQWDHPHKCHLAYTVIVLLNSDLAHSLILKPNWIKAWDHSCTQPHTDNLSKHTYSPENNYWRRIEANGHTQRQRHCHACRENNNCVWRWHPCCNTDHSTTVYSPSLLFTHEQSAWCCSVVLGDPVHSGDLSLESNRQQQKAPRASLLNYITVVHQTNCTCLCSSKQLLWPCIFYFSNSAQLVSILSLVLTYWCWTCAAIRIWKTKENSRCATRTMVAFLPLCVTSA